mgnify:CR=1 FL=1
MTTDIEAIRFREGNPLTSNEITTVTWSNSLAANLVWSQVDKFQQWGIEIRKNVALWYPIPFTETHDQFIKSNIKEREIHSLLTRVLGPDRFTYKEDIMVNAAILRIVCHDKQNVKRQ